MEKLKINDEVYTIRYSRWKSEPFYELSKVVRLTKTQAVLSNGYKVINEIYLDRNKKSCFFEYGDRWQKWYLLTDEVRLEYKNHQEKIKIRNWFDSRKFTDEEKRLVFLEFKKLNILKNN